MDYNNHCNNELDDSDFRPGNCLIAGKCNYFLESEQSKHFDKCCISQKVE